MIMLDFAAWKEDRAELRALRQQRDNAACTEQTLATILSVEAARIEAACDALDQITNELAHQGEQP